MRVFSFALLSGLVFVCVVSMTTATAQRGIGFNRSYDDSSDDSSSSSSSESADPNFAERFETDPRDAANRVVTGEALDRLTWNVDSPRFDGDSSGSLTATYDASLPAGLFGFELPQAFSAADNFTAAAAFVIDSEGFAADPNGFFQISWGLWNSQTTGLRRTGDPIDFSTDTFELIEMNYFPNVSSFFGGPFLAPAIFGEAVSGGAFANFSSLFDLEATLPFDVPLLAVIEHRPADGALVLQIHRIVDGPRLLPVNAAVGVAPLEFLVSPQYTVDTVGLTLWNDGFTGATPSVTATLEFHLLAVRPGAVDRLESLLIDSDGQ